MTRTRWTRARLLRAARYSGRYTVACTDGQRWTIRPVTRVGMGVDLWEDGTITRSDVRLDLATPLTVTGAAAALGLDLSEVTR